MIHILPIYMNYKYTTIQHYIFFPYFLIIYINLYIYIFYCIITLGLLYLYYIYIV